MPWFGLALAALVAGLGCTKSSGPVQRIDIDPAEVESLTVYVAGEDVTTDGAVIRCCVAELNALACTPLRPPVNLADTEDLVVHDTHGGRIAAFGISQGYCIRAVLPGSEPFYVRYEPIPTIGRLFSYCVYRHAKESLADLAERGAWNEDVWRNVHHHIIFLRYSRDALNPSPPTDLESLRQLVASLPEGGLDGLADFPDYFK